MKGILKIISVTYFGLLLVAAQLVADDELLEELVVEKGVSEKASLSNETHALLAITCRILSDSYKDAKGKSIIKEEDEKVWSHDLENNGDVIIMDFLPYRDGGEFESYYKILKQDGIKNVPFHTKIKLKSGRTFNLKVIEDNYEVYFPYWLHCRNFPLTPVRILFLKGTG